MMKMVSKVVTAKYGLSINRDREAILEYASQFLNQKSLEELGIKMDELPASWKRRPSTQIIYKTDGTLVDVYALRQQLPVEEAFIEGERIHGKRS